MKKWSMILTTLATMMLIAPAAFAQGTDAAAGGNASLSVRGGSLALHATYANTATAGEVALTDAGVDVKVVKSEANAGGATRAYVQEGATISAAQNITLPMLLAGRKGDPAWISQVIEITGIGDRLEHRPSEMSGGQQQRVAVARALVSEQQLILADEPTGNLDTANGEAVMALLKQAAASGVTVAMVTHSLVHAAEAQRTIKLLDGRVVSETLMAA